MDLQGPNNFIILIAVSIQIFPLIIFSDSGDPISISRERNWVPKTP